MRSAIARMVSLQLLLLLVSCAAAVSTAFSSCDFAALHPKRYAVRHLQRSSSRDDAYSASWSPASRTPTAAAAGITIDGLLNESAWEEAAWSESFVDIRGPRHWSQPWFSTKVKLRYDDQFLYVGAYLEESAVWANVTQRNAVVFHDNDFEVFVDADSSTHNYKEFEVNARNTTWNLWLNRPYRDGGHENSTRVDPQRGFDMFNRGMRSAVFMKGRPNDPAQQLHFWTVEIALPLQELAKHTRAVLPPAPLSFWRINFSRVEWAVKLNQQRYEKIRGQAEDNWVWSPQHAVDMHMPENWGYIQFRPHSGGCNDDEGETDTGAPAPEVPLDPEWNVRYLSFQFYYAQHAFRVANGYYAASLQALGAYFKSSKAFSCVEVRDLKVNNTVATETFEALVKSVSDPMYVARIRDDSFIQVHKDVEEIASVE